MTSPKDAGSNLREIILRKELALQGETIIAIAENLEHGQQYPNETPPLLAQLFKQTILIINKHLDLTSPKHLGMINKIYTDISQCLRFIERSRVNQTPWSMIQATESFFQKYVGNDCHFIIRPQWSFSYAMIHDFVSACEKCIDAFNWIDKAEWQKAFADENIDKKIYCISFPRILRFNCLSHANWGHELGHIIVANWMEKDFTLFFNEEQERLEKEFRDDIKNNPVSGMDGLLRDLNIETRIAEQISYTRDILKVGLEELLCDAIGVNLLGLSALASMYEFSSRFILDHDPLQKNYYPPWRYRLRIMWNICKNDILETSKNDTLTNMKPFFTWLSEIDELVSCHDDKNILSKTLVTQKAYDIIDKHFKTILSHILNKLQNGSFSPYKLSERLNDIDCLVKKLMDDIPPNEFDKNQSPSPASFEDILIAGWIYKIKKIFEDKNWGTYNDYDKMYRLLLKAIESGFVHQKYGPELDLLLED